MVDTLSNKELKGGEKLVVKSKKRKQEENKEKRSKKSAKNVIHNTQQCADFKLKKDKLWLQFAGKCLTNRAKVNRTIMCTHWHTRACCFTDCKHRASHLACSLIPVEAKQAHLRWIQKVRSRNK